jgi:hypothetical protein
MKKIKQGGGIGFRPDRITTYIQRLLGFVIYIFRINGKNSLSNEFIQKLDPINVSILYENIFINNLNENFKNQFNIIFVKDAG